MAQRERSFRIFVLVKLLKFIKYLASADFSLRMKRWEWIAASRSAIGRYLLHQRYSVPAANLQRDVFGIHFCSPIGLAAGFDRNGEMIDAMAAAGFGFVEIGSVTPKPQRASRGEAGVYMLRGDKALIYRADIESDGVEKVIENIKQRRSRVVVGCNIAKNTSTPAEEATGDYLRLFRPLYQYVDYFTVNVCCNTTAEPYVPATKQELMAILAPLFDFRRGQNQYRPILLKISPDLSDEQIDVMIDIMLDTPLDGIVACGGTLGRHGLKESTSQMHAIGRTHGAMCGRPLRSRAVEVVSRIYSRSKGTYPIIGCGGVSTPDDAFKMLQAGATLVQIGSEFIYGGAESLRNMHLGLDERLRKAEQRVVESNATTADDTADADADATESAESAELAATETTTAVTEAASSAEDAKSADSTK